MKENTRKSAGPICACVVAIILLAAFLFKTVNVLGSEEIKYDGASELVMIRLIDEGTEEEGVFVISGDSAELSFIADTGRSVYTSAGFSQ